MSCRGGSLRPLVAPSPGCARWGVSVDISSPDPPAYAGVRRDAGVVGGWRTTGRRNPASVPPTEPPSGRLPLFLVAPVITASSALDVASVPAAPDGRFARAVLHVVGR